MSKLKSTCTPLAATMLGRIHLFAYCFIACLALLCLGFALTGCSAHCWTNDHNNIRITSDPPWSYPEENPRW